MRRTARIWRAVFRDYFNCLRDISCVLNSRERTSRRGKGEKFEKPEERMIHERWINISPRCGIRREGLRMTDRIEDMRVSMRNIYYVWRWERNSLKQENKFYLIIVNIGVHLYNVRRINEIGIFAITTSMRVNRVCATEIINAWN